VACDNTRDIPEEIAGYRAVTSPKCLRFAEHATHHFEVFRPISQFGEGIDSFNSCGCHDFYAITRINARLE
jgi:hypothetical protein